MGDLKALFKAKFLRRHSAVPSPDTGKQSLNHDRTSGSTHTQSSTTGYAASLSTTAGDENDKQNESRIHESAKDKIVHDSVTSSGECNSLPRENGNERASAEASVDEAPSQDEEQTEHQAEAVPPELRKLNPNHQQNIQKNASSSSSSSSTAAAATVVDANVVNVEEKSEDNLTRSSPTSPTSTTTQSGKDLQISAINPTTIPNSISISAITTPTSTLDATADTIPITTTTAAVTTPLPRIYEHPLHQNQEQHQLKAPTLDQHHHHHHHLHHDDGPDDYHRRPVSAGRTLSPSLSRPTAPPRRQSILPNRQTTLIKALLNTGYANDIASPDPDQLLPISGNMVTRKVWVKRPLASPTLITINEDDLVDDVRELILRKYANSLGRQYDAPDLTLRICDREQQTTRTLQPDEPMGRTLDAYYPGGQSVDDALLIDIPSRRTPKASPNPRFYGDDRPHESGTDYFPPYPPISSQHPSASSAIAINGNHFPPSLAIINGAQLPPLPSPGGTRRLGSSRPKIQRMHTASPVSTVANTHASQSGAAPTGMHNHPRQPRSRTHSGASSEQSNHPPTAPTIPTPPVPERIATPPPPRVSSPRPINRPKKSKKPIEHPSLPPGMLNGGVPPINVLIVEDNIINLKLLEAFVKRLKVRWQTAMNGREAVNKWRAGGFHLVLMDIQLPVMSGLEATREIRRIEKVNSIGVFSSSASSPPDEVKAEPAEEDKLVNTEMFKSPVIIVALTASSLQSDRHEALAAGCNDFLTKPVNFVWLERKVMEWGCMQALIDFDGWRKWKDFSQKAEENDSKKAAAAKGAKLPKKNRLPMTAAA